MNEKPSLYAIIPANVRYDKNLRANEKLLYGELTALTNKHGYCFASNNYFAELYEVTPQAVSRWINNLKKRGYITIEYTYKSGTNQIEQRLIRMVSTNDLGVSTNVSKVSTKSSEVSTNDLGGYQQKVKGNNNIINNIYNNKYNNKDVSSFSLSSHEINQPISNNELDNESFMKMIEDIKRESY